MIDKCFSSLVKKFIGLQIGIFIITEIVTLDDNTMLICCQDMPSDINPRETRHLEIEYWLDTKTYHSEYLYYTEQGEYIDCDRFDLEDEDSISFKNVFKSLTQA